jgi:hypothetical protein
VKTLVFLVEERSMKEYLDVLLPKLLPESIATITIPHEGKTDLKQSVPRKLAAWNDPNARFAVLIDQDSNDCRRLKEEILSLCVAAGKPETLVRIVCRTLESWIMGDLHALGAAFGTSFARHQNKNPFRVPDACGDPIGTVRQLHPTYQKTSGARLVAAHARVDSGENASASFRVFIAAVRRLAEKGAWR